MAKNTKTLDKLLTLLASPDESFVTQGLDLLSMVISTDDALYAAFAQGKICGVTKSGKPVCKQIF